MNILALVEAIKNYSQLASQSVEKTPTSNDLAVMTLHGTKQKLTDYERKKYPSEFFKYQQFAFVDQDGATYTICDTTALKPLKLTMEQRQHIKSHAFRVRKLSILAGILNTMVFYTDFAPSFLGITDEKTRTAVIEILFSFIADEFHSSREANINIKVFLDDVVCSLANVLKKNDAGLKSSEIKSILNQIRTVERYFIADYKKNHLFINEMMIDGESYIQVDKYFSKLIPEQKLELLKIHADETPNWFSYLPAWEQKWLQQVVPTELASDWSYFESLSQSSMMSQIPGIQNARMNHLIYVDEKNYTLLSTGLRMATMVPQEIHSCDEDILRHTKETAMQVLTHLKENLPSFWQDNDLDQLKPLIFIQSLLSDVSGISATQHDKRLAEIQKSAIELIKQKNHLPDVEIIAGNDPLNGFRYIKSLSDIFVESTDPLKHSEELLAYTDKFLQVIKKQENVLKQKDKIEIIEKAKSSLEKLIKSNYKTQLNVRNIPAYKIAYSAFLVEEMYGIFSLNCKSGKDRTQIQEIYNHTVRIYFRKYGVLPQCDDSGEKRKNFVRIFVLIFNSMKAQEAASKNAPGSFGLKLDRTMVCSDIFEELNKTKTYELSLTLAGINKPKQFLSSEANASRERSFSIRNLTNQSLKSPRDIEDEDKEENITDLKNELEAFRNASKTFNPEDMDAFISPLKKELEAGIANNERIFEWRMKFDELKKLVQTVNKLKQKIKALQEEIAEFMDDNPAASSNKNLQFIIKSLENADALYFKGCADLQKPIIKINDTILKMREVFAKAKKTILEEQKKRGSQESGSQASSPEVSPPVSARKPTISLSSSALYFLSTKKSKKDKHTKSASLSETPHTKEVVGQQDNELTTRNVRQMVNDFTKSNPQNLPISLAALISPTGSRRRTENESKPSI